jgi:hypothetical protein
MANVKKVSEPGFLLRTPEFVPALRQVSSTSLSVVNVRCVNRFSYSKALVTFVQFPNIFVLAFCF